MPRPKLRDEDLRDRLVTAGLEVLLAEGPIAVTARHVATAAGTSTAALYELFGDKGGLIREVFFEGFEQLASRLDAVETSDDARADVLAVLAEVRAMALESPMLHGLMTGRPFVEFDPSDVDAVAAKRVYRNIVRRVRRWAADAPVEPVDSATVLVAANNGVIDAQLSGVLASSPQRCDQRWHLAMTALLDGLSGERGGAER